MAGDPFVDSYMGNFGEKIDKGYTKTPFGDPARHNG
jgi:hypothetical protein